MPDGRHWGNNRIISPSKNPDKFSLFIEGKCTFTFYDYKETSKIIGFLVLDASSAADEKGFQFLARSPISYGLSKDYSEPQPDA